MKTNESLLFQLRCCYETQQPLACAHVISTFQGKIELRNQRLTPTDCLAVGYAINKSGYSNVDLDLYGTDIGDAGAQVLGAALMNCTTVRILM